MENQEKRKGKRGKVIAMVIAAVVAIAAIGLWFTGIIGGISETEAKEIAYGQVPGAAEADSAIVTKEFDDLGKVYEVQILQDNILYEFTISARNGNILSQDIEGTGAPQQDAASVEQQETVQEKDTQTAQVDISLDEAKQIALSEVSGAAEADVTAAQLDDEDGRMVYEVEIRYDGQEYDFDIDAATGDIISRDQESVFD